MDVSLAQLDEAGAEFLPGLLGIHFGEYTEPGVVHAQITIDGSMGTAGAL